MSCECGCNAAAPAVSESTFIAHTLPQVDCGCGCGGACGCGGSAASDGEPRVRLAVDEQAVEPRVAELKPAIV